MWNTRETTPHREHSQLKPRGRQYLPVWLPCHCFAARLHLNPAKASQLMNILINLKLQDNYRLQRHHLHPRPLAVSNTYQAETT